MKKQKKFLILMLAATMIFMVGCKSNEDNNGNSADGEISNDYNPVESLGLDYEKGLDEEGFFENVKATDFVVLSDYKSILIPKATHVITEEAVQSRIDQILSSYATTLEVTDRAAANGDTVNIDFIGRVDGEEFVGGNTGGEGTEVTIGVTNYIEGFLDQLIGHEPGETFDIEVTFPADYGDEALNGKDAVFEITLNHISETVFPELTDEFVKENLLDTYASNTVESFQATIKSDLKEIAIKSFIQEYLLTNMVVSSIPEEVMDFQVMSMENYYKTSALSYNISVEEFLATYVGYATLDEVVEAAADQLKGTSEISLIIQAIAEDSNLTVTKEHIDTYFTKYIGVDDYSEFEQIYGLSYLKNSILQETVLDMLVAEAELEE